MGCENKQQKKEPWIEDELLTAEDFAWAFLRRNPDYCREVERYSKVARTKKMGVVIYVSGKKDVKALKWGLEFFRRSRRKSGFRSSFLGKDNLSRNRVSENNEHRKSHCWGDNGTWQLCMRQGHAPYSRSP